MAAKTGWSVREFIYFFGFLSICGFLVGITCLASLVAKCKESTSFDTGRPGTNRDVIRVRICLKSAYTIWAAVWLPKLSATQSACDGVHSFVSFWPFCQGHMNLGGQLTAANRVLNLGVSTRSW